MNSKKKKSSAIICLIMCVLMVLCGVLEWGIQSGWGKIRIERVRLAADNGLMYSAVMYIPKTAKNDNPAPLAILYHGNSGNAKSHEGQAIEYARRGFVVITADNNGGGESEFANKDKNIVAARIFTDYALSLKNIDPKRVVMGGHSMGGDMAVQMGATYKPAVLLVSDNGGMGEEIGANNGNTLYINGSSDKLNPMEKYQKRAADRFKMNGVDMGGDEIAQLGKLYGSFKDGNASLMVAIEGQVHEAAVVNADHLEAMLDFTMQSFDVPNAIPADDQIWQRAFAVGQIGMILFAAFLCTFAVMLAEYVPAFNIVKQPLPRNIGMRKLPFVISLICGLGFPLLTLYTGAFGLIDAIGGRKPNLSWLPVKYTNFALAIIIALNIFGLIMFFVYHFTWGKKNFQAGLDDYGITVAGSKKISLPLIAKAAVVAAITVIVGWTFLAAQYGLLGIDFYCMYWGYKPIAADKFVYYIGYIIIWAICFAIAALGMCVERRLPSTGKEWLDTLIAMAFNVVVAAGAITAMVLIENAIQVGLGTSATALAGWKTDMTRIWGMPVGMIIGAAGNTYCFRKTGNIWLGAFLMGTVCALSACTYGQIAF